MATDLNYNLLDKTTQSGAKPKDNPLSYKIASASVKKLCSTWGEYRSKVEDNRDSRYLDVDTDMAKWSGLLAQDELFTPIKLIDRNIRREQSKYINYLVSSRRLAIFSNNDDPGMDSAPLEKDFTKRAKYPGWQLPYFSCIDSFQQNGWDCLEVIFDKDKPGRFAVEDIGYDNLLFPTDTKNLQSCAFLVRLHFYTKSQLEDMVEKNGFSAEQVAKITDEVKDNISSSLIQVEKYFCRVKGVIYVGWTSHEKCTGWLRAPRPLFLGRMKPTKIKGSKVKWEVIAEIKYPIVFFPYIVSENPRLTALKGRGFLDEAIQDACTSLMTSHVTGMRRASQPYASPSENSGGALEQTDIKIGGGTFVSQPANFWQMSPPPAGNVTTVQGLISDNAQENSSTNYAVLNREDSRKTAEEIKVATSEAAQLSAVQVAVFSIAMRDVLQLCWLIFHSQVIQGNIKVKIDLSYYTDYVYTVVPSGDTDVIERQEKIQAMMKAWPVIQATGAKDVFLKHLIRLLFPDEAQEYIDAIQEDKTGKALVMSLSQLLHAFTNDPQSGQLNEVAQQFGPQLKQIDTQVQQYLQANQNEPAAKFSPQ